MNEVHQLATAMLAIAFAAVIGRRVMVCTLLIAALAITGTCWARAS
jgi:hypothetical protein